MKMSGICPIVLDGVSKDPGDSTKFEQNKAK